MRRAGRNRWMLFCLCICLGVFAAGCSGQSAQKDSGSEKVEYQAENEASDTGSEDADGISQDDAKTVLTESSTEPATEEELTPEDVTVYNYASMDNVLAAMVSAMQESDISRYYRDGSGNDLAVNYLYAYVNLFDHDTFEQVSMKGKDHDSYVKLKPDYLEELLIYAFGDTITSRDLKADGDLLLKKGDAYYAALDEVQPVVVDYTGFENEDFTESTVFSFDYEMYLDNGDTEDGIMQVRFQESDQVESGIILKVVALTQY
ncbi:MAG: hypothetical protein ACI4D3_04290 [Lachnospiraceae bacterium]